MSTATAAPPQITRTLVRLHLRLLRRSIATDSQVLANIIIFLVFGVAGTVGLGFWGYGQYLETGFLGILASTLGLGSILYVTTALITPTGDKTIDYRALAPLPLPSRAVLPGSLWVMLLSPRALVAALNSLIMAAFGIAAFAQSHGASDGFSTLSIVGLSFAWLLTCLLQFVATILLAEAVQLGLSSRGKGVSERISFLVSALFLVVVLVLNIQLSSQSSSVDPMLASISLTQWTPFAAPAGAFIAGAAWVGASEEVLYSIGPATLLLQLGIAALTLVVTIYVIATSITNTLREPLAQKGSRKQAKRSASSGGRHSKKAQLALLLPGLPATTTGGIVAANLRQVRRDSRFSFTIGSALLIAAFYYVLGMFGSDENPMFTWGPLYAGTVLVCMISNNPLGYDGPANWVNMTSGVRARSFLLARLTHMVIIMAVIWAIICVVLIASYPPSTALWVNLAVSFMVVIMIYGLGAFFGTHNAAPTSPPGTSPTKDRSAKGGAVLVPMLGSLFGVMILSIPAIVLTVSGHPWAAIGYELLVTVIIVCGGLWLGAKRLNRAWPEIFTKVRTYK